MFFHLFKEAYNEYKHFDVQPGCSDGVYDVWIATESSSGSHYPNINADKIGEYTADLIDTLEEAESGQSYLNNQKMILPICDSDYDSLNGSLRALLKNWNLI